MAARRSRAWNSAGPSVQAAELELPLPAMAEDQWSEVDEYFSEKLLPRDPVLESALEASVTGTADLSGLEQVVNTKPFLLSTVQLTRHLDHCPAEPRTSEQPLCSLVPLCR